MDNNHKARAAFLLGLGFDNDDGHVRITQGRNFHILGGSEKTHETMQEKCIQFNEELNRRSKELGDLEPDEVRDIAHEIGLNPRD